MTHTYTKRQLVEDFEVVAEHYRLRELGEYDIAKGIARDDMNSAMVCYHDLAERIRGSA